MTTAPCLFSTDFDVRGYEMDSLGHVNNAVYLHWFEHARWSMVGPDGVLPHEPAVRAVLRHISVDYLRPTHVYERVRVRLWPLKLGQTSFTLGGEVLMLGSAAAVGGEPVAAAQCTQTVVCITPQGDKVAVPAPWRAAFSLRT